MAVNVLTGTLHDALNHPDKQLLGVPASGTACTNIDLFLQAVHFRVICSTIMAYYPMHVIYLTVILRANVLSRYLSPHLEVQRPRPEALAKELKAIGSNTGPYTQPA